MNKKQRREQAREAQGEFSKAAAIAEAAGAPAEHVQAVRNLDKPAKQTKSGLPALPTMKRTRKPKPAQDCSCGCGGQTKGGRFLPGHDARLHGWVLRVERGVCTLRDVEASDGRGVASAVAAKLPDGTAWDK